MKKRMGSNDNYEDVLITFECLHSACESCFKSNGGEQCKICKENFLLESNSPIKSFLIEVLKPIPILEIPEGKKCEVCDSGKASCW